MITKYDLERFGKEASAAFISDGVNLNTTIEKIASTKNLSRQQINRVVESANVDTYLGLMKSSADKYVDFPLADSNTIYSSVVPNISQQSNNAHSDYESPPEKTAEIDIFKVNSMEKTASEKIDYSSIRKQASKVEGICKFLLDGAAEARVKFASVYDNIWDLTKQEVLSGTNFSDVSNVIKVASPSYSDYIKEDFSEYLSNTVPHIDITKEASHKGVINPKSDLFKLASSLEDIGDRYNKIIGAVVHYSDKYDSLRKEASVAGGLKNLFLGTGQTLGSASIGMAKAVSAHKKLILAGIGGYGAYRIGKTKGKAEQGALLQRKMLKPKYRNLMY